MKQKDIAIVHFNTPELTEAAILSVRKHCKEDYRFTVFDNSDHRPFKTKLKGVKVIDNTKGQVIDFEAELAKYPEKEWEMAKKSNHGSFKHIITVQKLWDLLPDGFILLESDVLITKNFDFLWQPEFAACGKVQYNKRRPREKDRLLPWLCYMNVPLLKKHGARYFDPMRCWNLQPGEDNPGNWWDTGACLLDDIRNTKPWLVCRCYAGLDQYYIHYNGGSWRANDLDNQLAFVNQHRDLWEPDKRVESKDVAICAIVRCENKYLVEWCSHHLRLGVKKIFIYDNGHGNEERPDAVLDALINAGQVEICDARNMGGNYNVQDTVYMDCYQKHGGEFAWIGFIDIDEFVMVRGRTKLPTLLGKFDTADAVVLPWQMMTDSGYSGYSDEGVVKRFTEHVVGKRYPGGEEFVKCFVRGGLGHIVFQSQPHCPTAPPLKVVNIQGEPVKQYPTVEHPLYTVAWVNHYHTRTAEEFLEKMRRGFPNGDQYTAGYLKKAIDYFFAINERTEEKEAILGCGKPQTRKSRNSKKTK